MAEEKSVIPFGKMGVLAIVITAIAFIVGELTIPVILITGGVVTFSFNPLAIFMILLGVTMLILGGGVITWLLMHGTVIAIIVGIILGLKLIKAF